MSSYAGLGGGGGLGLIGLNMVMGPNGSSSSRKSRGKVAGSVGNRATGDAQKIGNIQTENPGVHGIHQSMDGGGSPHGNALQWKNGRQYLAYSPQEVPYPRSYDKIAIDHDTTNHLFLNRLRNGLTWHEFNPEPSGFSAPSSSLNKEPQSSVKSSKSHTETETGSMSWKPNNILDLGCGNGVWILDAANLWPDAMFTGLDIAPIQPSLSLLAPRLAKRIQWVNANFLEQLPFPTSHFDFVRICRIARGVPEHKWKEFFKEVSRVLKPGGALEVFEEDLVFPGGAEKVRHPPLNTKINYGEESARSSPGSLRSSSNASTIRYRSTLSSLEQAYKDMHHERRISLRPISILSNILPAFFHEVQSHPPVLMTFPPPEEEIWSDSSSSASDSDVSARSRRIVRRNVAKGEQSRRAVTYRGSTISRLSTIASSIAYSMGSSGVDSSAGGSPPQLSPRELHMDEIQRETLDIDTGGEHSPTSTLGRRLQEYASDQPISYTNAPTKESFHHPTANAADSKNTAGGSISPLMNPVYNLDLHSLTLSLALNVTDVLECKESIWDFMVQAGHSKPLKQPTRLHEAANEETSIGGHHGEKELSPSNRKRSHSDSSSLPRLSLDTTASDKSFITREEFDQWFIDYEEEMHGRLQLAKALQSRLNWRTRGLTSADSGLATSQYPFFHLNSTPLNRESLGSSSLGVGDIVLAPEQPPSDWPFALSLSDVEDGGTVSPPFSNSSSTSLWYEEGNSEEGGTAEYSPDNMSHQSDEKDKSTIHDEDRSEVFSSRPHRQSPPKAKDRRAHSRIRSHTGDVQPRRLRTHHSRGYSLDAANAWKLLAQENSHLGPLSLSTKSILRSPHATKQVSENKSDVWNEHLPGLSRCVKVFVARNSKTE